MVEDAKMNSKHCNRSEPVSLISVRGRNDYCFFQGSLICSISTTLENEKNHGSVWSKDFYLCCGI